MTGPVWVGLVLQRLAVPASPQRRSAYLHGDGELTGAGLTVEPGGLARLDGWFNAAPVAWWASLGISGPHLVVCGRGAVRLMATKSGTTVELAASHLNGSWRFNLPDGAVEWAWLEVMGEVDGARIDTVEWRLPQRPEPVAEVSRAPKAGAGVPGGSPPGPKGPESGMATTGAPQGEPPSGPPGVVVVVPTFRREDDCRRQAERLLDGPAADGVAALVVIDQGDSLIAGGGLDQIQARHPDRLVLISQANLGGSGGYARGMAVAAERWPDSPVFLHDDDAEIDPEVLRRLVVLTAVTVRPTIFGTGLLDPEHPTQLRTLAEGVRRRTFNWGPIDGLRGERDIGLTGPAGWDFTHHAQPCDYVGWWGAMLPAGCVRQIGLPAPFFLKWDDAEYGLRAGSVGIGAVSLPGTAVWHPSWETKGTIASWQAWPLHRNRLATALTYQAGRGVLASSLVHQLKHLVRRAWGTAELWNAALAQVASGPGWLWQDLTLVRPRAAGLIEHPLHRLGLARAWAALIRTVGLHLRLALTWRRLRRLYPEQMTASRQSDVWATRFAGETP